MRLAPLAVVLVGALGAHAAHSAALDERAQWPEDEDLLYLPASQHMRVMSVGYREALADLVWVRAVVFAGSALGRENYDWIRQYLRIINDLVPTFRRPYAWGGVVTIYNGKPIDKEAVDVAVGIYREGIENFPEDHELLFALGMILSRDVTLELGYTQAEVDAARNESVELVRRAAAFGAPPIVRQLAATLVADGAADELAIQFLEAQLLSTDDEGYQRLLEQKLTRLVGERRLDEMVRMRTRFWQERDARLPYVDDTIYALIRDEAPFEPPPPKDKRKP